VTDLLLALAAIDPPNEPGIGRALGVPLVFEAESNSYISYRAAFESGPFSTAEVRVNFNEPTGVLSLWPNPEVPVHEDDVDRTPFGEELSIETNPRIPPEGTVTYVHRIGHAKLNFQFRYASRTLYSVSIVWDKKEAA
jgi:hypothetical protein